MRQLEPPTLDLDSRSYRVVRTPLWLMRLRHPIYAFMAYQEAYKDPPESRARQQSMMFAAFAHGIAGWLLLQR